MPIWLPWHSKKYKIKIESLEFGFTYKLQMEGLTPNLEFELLSISIDRPKWGSKPCRYSLVLFCSQIERIKKKGKKRWTYSSSSSTNWKVRLQSLYKTSLQLFFLFCSNCQSVFQVYLLTFELLFTWVLIWCPLFLWTYSLFFLFDWDLTKFFILFLY